ncbi:hypothetical protein WJX73_008991 [Symbiochloris irregularis]|uniref:Uncharacterized protein n=1 Tax=Symbiochloris irregularis TaxID=706552 RepID=A0AAW1PM03_9CHLO
MDMTPPVGGCESKEHGQDHESAFEAGTQLADSARTILPEEMEDASDDYMEEMRSPHAFKGMETRCEGLGLLESLQQLAPHLTPDPPRKWPPSLLIERRLWDSATPEDQGQALQQLRQLGLTSAVLDPA